jgi:hypothetical protein
MVVSDGEHYMQAMLTSQLTQLVTSSQLKAFSVVGVKESICNTMQGKKCGSLAGAASVASLADTLAAEC